MGYHAASLLWHQFRELPCLQIEAKYLDQQDDAPLDTSEATASRTEAVVGNSEGYQAAHGDAESVTSPIPSGLTPAGLLDSQDVEGERCHLDSTYRTRISHEPLVSVFTSLGVWTLSMHVHQQRTRALCAFVSSKGVEQARRSLSRLGEHKVIRLSNFAQSTPHAATALHLLKAEVVRNVHGPLIHSDGCRPVNDWVPLIKVWGRR